MALDRMVLRRVEQAILLAAIRHLREPRTEKTLLNVLNTGLLVNLDALKRALADALEYAARAPKRTREGGRT
jgi:hypothetical protein